MLRYALRRAVWLLPTLVLVTFLVYVALRLGTDPLASYRRTNIRVSKKKVDEYIAANGLYDGAFGYVRGYFQWLWGFVTLDWPRSIKGSREVWPHLKDALANSIRLGLVASTVGILVGNSFGVLAALRPGRLRDTVVNSGALIGLAVPPFVSALLAEVVRLCAVPGVRRVPTRAPGVRSLPHDQAHGPAGGGRLDPVHRRVLALHAGFPARCTEQ
jgi:ABC-type dipeptide/oligopeptide/nickel transport system permease component